MFSLINKTAVVTGGTGVLGSAFCKGLAEAGARVVILGRRKELAEQKARELTDQGYTAMGVAADVLDMAQLQAANNEILSKYSTIDILVNGAGGNMPGATIMPDKTIFDINLSDLDAVLKLNLQGTIYPTQVFGKVMANQKSGSIINISSMTAAQAQTRVMGYSVAKTAIDGYTRWMSMEMALKFGEGIRVNAIAPGYFLTEQNLRLLTHEDGSLTQRGKLIIQNTPFKRFGKPEELVGTLIWLASDASAFVSGVVVPVDGGFIAWNGI
ncbi:MAG: SDR family oxidoreductase [Cytophagales bacterium]|nr:SDR family oxidoreductase [Cytophagales bacterium]